MAEQTPAEENRITPSPENGRDAKAAAPTAAQPPNKADEDPMRELLEHFERAQPVIANLDRNLAHTIQALTQQGADPERRAQPAFRHQVAYALQNLEKLPVWPMPITPQFRSEITRLAATAPGLENQHMLALMRGTASVEDKRLVQDIRRAGTEIGRQADQSTPATQTTIEALENRVRLSPRRAELPPDPRHAASERRLEANTAHGGPPPHDDPASQQSPVTRQSHPIGALDTIFRGMRPKDQGSGAPWNPPPTPMAGRLAAFESQMQERCDERALGRAERSGRAALDALGAFRTGEGAIVMNRIRAAARAEPGGIAAVLTEMRPGGRFADLRQQFNNALQTERGVAAAYDKAAAALARYGQDRVGIEQVIARRPDAANLSAKFEQMDAQTGEAAGGTPSRRDGKSMMDDLAQKAAELLQRAVDAAKSLFNRSPSAEAATRAAPAPSMSI
jgi:hypothetical protein